MQNSRLIYANRPHEEAAAADKSYVARPERSEARFAPSIEEVVAARQFASRVVVDAGLAHAVHDVALATGELAANAAEHARTPFDVLVLVGGCIRIEVTDGSGAMPVKREIDMYSERGRGIALVELVAHRWGVDVTAEGKKVWAEISL
jgi:anti-sigma regulatory factor (Ser/Thr protein kinase)